MRAILIESLRGREIDLLRPTPADVDFREIADTLAQISHYNGAALKPLSVAYHTLIVCDAAPDPIKPWALLHECHEARLGNIAPPVQKALIELGHHYSLVEPSALEIAITELIHLHSDAIHRAAGLPLPSIKRCEAIHRANLVALATERRDFLGPGARRWAAEIEAVAPLRKVYRLRAAPDIADELFARFQTTLPALARR